MSEFYLVRHGQASFGAENYDKLSQLGQQQAVWLGEFFAERDIHFDYVLSGDLVRHKETASGICSVFDKPVNNSELPQLNEFDFESLAQAYLSLHPTHRPTDNAPRADFYRLLKRAMLSWSEGRLPRELLAETWNEFEQRIVEAIEYICNHFHSKRILVVSSGGAIAMLMSRVLGFDAAQVINLNLQIKNASFSHFYFNPNNVRLSSFNNVPHLDQIDRVGAVTFS